MKNSPTTALADYGKMLSMMDTAGVEKFSQPLFEKRDLFEKTFSENISYSSTEITDMIINYALLLQNLHGEKTLHDIGQPFFTHEDMSCLLAAAYTVGFTLGKGGGTPLLLPIHAIAGVNSTFAKDVTDKIIALCEPREGKSSKR